MNILNTIAAALCLVAALRALYLFHCHLGLAGRAALAALGFFAWTGIATGQLVTAAGISQGLLLSIGALAGVLLWRFRSLGQTCSVPTIVTDSNGRKATLVPTSRATRV